MILLNDNQKKIADELDKIEIEQLHKATLNFSNNSLETKKLCVTMQIAVYTLLAGIYKEKPISDLVIALSLLGVLVPVLFYIVDVVLYYYQAKLRKNMQKNIDNIRLRHNLTSQLVDSQNSQEQIVNTQSSESQTTQERSLLFRSFFNGSQILYLGLAIISVSAPWLIKFFIEMWEEISGKI